MMALLHALYIFCRYKYQLTGEAVGLGVSGGVTALCLILLSSALFGGSAAQNTGDSTCMCEHVQSYIQTFNDLMMTQ